MCKGYWGRGRGGGGGGRWTGSGRNVVYTLISYNWLNPCFFTLSCLRAANITVFYNFQTFNTSTSFANALITTNVQPL